MPFALTMPKLSPTMTEGTISKWHKKEGEFCEADELILDIATDKATIEHHALDPGFLRKILVQEGSRVSVGDPLAIFSEEEKEDISRYSFKEEPSAPQPTKEASQAPIEIQPKAPEVKEPSLAQRIAASPLAKKLAKERNIPLEGITGSGPKGRIMSRDLEKGSAAKSSANEIAISPMRKVIGERLSFSKQTIPHFYCSIQVDATQLHAGREELKNIGHAITINDIIIRAVALSLMKHAPIRACFNKDRESILVHEHADIAVAVSVPGGLITPIIFNAEEKSIHEISHEMKALAEKAKTGKLLPQEYQGGAFTISNLGMFGIDQFYPIINPPQVAILGVGAIADAPLIHEGSIVVGKMLTLCIAADHRAVDGTETAAFLKTLKEMLERPAQLVL